jgi:citrate lyase subunit beta/citryl-CoA lyase
MIGLRRSLGYNPAASRIQQESRRMPASLRPRRSVLYMPGSNSRALDKARGLAADGLIFDLEDAVAPDAKAASRDTVAASVAAGGYGARELFLRVNALTTPWGYADLAAAARMGVDAVLLPKVESADAVRQAQSVLEAHDAPGGLGIWCMMETPRGMLHAEEIAGASPRVGGLVMGTSDLAKDLHAQHTRDRLPMLTALSLCLLAARAYDLAILDGVHLDLADDEGFAQSCRQGHELGFDGKTLIHPKTIAVANAAFAPSPEEVAWSRRIIAAHQAASAAGKGVVLVEGKLIETLHVESARRLVALADSIVALDASPP